MQNDKKEIVDLYIPRKCSATGKLITAKDHASIQFNVGEVNEQGVYNGRSKAYAICGYLRTCGEADDSLNRVLTKDGYLKSVWSYSPN
jgi:small subunit ribosomal protein S21e